MKNAYVASALALVVLVPACSAATEREVSPTASHSASSAATGAVARTVTVDDLAATGLQIVADELAQSDPDGGLLFTRSQVASLVAEHAAGDGILGRDLDALAPLPEGSPPMSFLVAGWIELAPTPASRAAAALMGKHDWTSAQTIVFPSSVLTMFVADLAAAMTAGPRTARPTRSWERGSLLPVRRIDDPCSTATGFLAKAIDSIYRSLKLEPQDGGFFDFLPQWLKDVWNVALNVARGIVQAVATELTRPVFEILRTAMGIVAVAVEIRSYLRKVSLTVRLDPKQSGHYRFAVDPEADREGSFVAEANAGDIDWPKPLQDCAKVSGISLPEALPAGTKVVWKLDDKLGLIQPKGPNVTQLTTIRDGGRDKRRTVLEFKTGRESAEQAKGEEQWHSAYAMATLERKELDELLKQVHELLDGTLARLTNGLPPLVRDAVIAILHKIVDPVANWLKAEIAKRATGIFTVSGTGHVFVMFHKPKEPTPTPSPKTKPAGGAVTARQVLFGGDIYSEFVGCSGVYGPWRGTHNVLFTDAGTRKSLGWSRGRFGFTLTGKNKKTSFSYTMPPPSPRNIGRQTFSVWSDGKTLTINQSGANLPNVVLPITPARPGQC
jgi:hypothetical protein